MNDDIDLEDLECRLYSQVYHSNIEDEETNLQSEFNLNLRVNDNARKNRYFSKRVLDQSVFIPLPGNDTNFEKIYSPVYNNISFNPSTGITTEGNFSQFQNNITVNQYTVPFILNTELSEVLNSNCGNILVTRPNGKQREKIEAKITRAQKRLERRKRRKERRNTNIVCVKTVGHITKKSNSIIFISDDSDGECIIVKDINKKTVREKFSPSSKALENSGFESDNDIIYVPPPPIEVINVDVDIEGENSKANEVLENTILSLGKTNNPQTCSNELSNTLESCTSNDFLDNSGLENNSNNFNFGLHGSDFNSTGDFLRPANPVEYCETESSCSTNDLNRENNSVKTIVFNEVDFPREDIFSDKNLENFSSYITPKRNQTNKKLNDSSKSCSEQNESSSSSSESDYEPPDIINKNIKRADVDACKKLPTLSPMQCDKVVTSNKKLRKKKLELNTLKNDLNVSPRSTKKLSSKRKSDTLERTKSDSDNNEHQFIVRLPKRKKKNMSKKRNSSEETDKNINSDADIDEVNVAHAADINNEEYNDSVIESTENNTNRNTCKKKKKNKKNEGDSTTNSNSIDTNLEKIKKKKRKHLSPENIVNDTSTNESNPPSLGQVRTDDIITRNLIVDDTISDKRDIHSLQEVCVNISVSSEPTADKIKRKKKKSVSEILVNDVIENISKIKDCSQVTYIDNENGLPISKHISIHGSKRSIGSVVEIHEDTRRNDSFNLSAKDSNGQNVNSIKSRNVVHDIEGDISENPCTLESLFLNASEQNEIGEDIVIIDEVGPDDDDPEIIVSSDSADGSIILQDLELGNCISAGTSNSKEINNVNSSDGFTDRYVKNKNLCEDYSKFDVEQIQSTQTDDPEAWKISALDKLKCLNFNKKKGPRCTRCRQFGHFGIRCPEKPNPPACILCGLSDHQEPRCPNKRCHQCGNEGDYSTTYCWKCVKFRNFVCRICNMTGHIANNCPDLWRRYHLTTEEGPIVESNGQELKPRNQLWCSGCAGQGHLEHECNSCIREYPPTNPYIMSYKDVLQECEKNSTQNTTPPPPPSPIISAPQQNNYLLPTPFTNFSSTTTFGAPHFIPPLIPQLTNLNPFFPIRTILNGSQIVVPNHNINHDQHFPPAPRRVINPFSVHIQQETQNVNLRVLDRMMEDYVNDGNNVNYLRSQHMETGKVMVKRIANELIRKDKKRTKHIIMSMPAHVVHEFLSKEIADLENVVSYSDPRYLKEKLSKYENISHSRKALNCNIVKEKCFWYRILNMFIFGVHQIKDGNLHIKYIKRYLCESKSRRMDTNKRKSLLNAYNYIFDANQRGYINYYKILQQLIRTQFNSGN